MTPFKNYSVEKKNRKPENRKLFSYVPNISENNIDTALTPFQQAKKTYFNFLNSSGSCQRPRVCLST